MDTAIAAVLGVAVGAALVLLLLFLRRGTSAQLARQLLEQAEHEKLADIQGIVSQVQAEFGKLSQEALSANSEQFLRLAETKLSAQSKQGEITIEAKKKLIDETVKQITAKLTEVGTTLQTLEKDRRQSHGTLLQATTALRQMTGKLSEALAGSQTRGQWGERMADDILRLIGFVEGVNYEKQSATDAGSKPDFTFLLPQGRRVNMDVKFPLANYLKHLEATEEATREQHQIAFLRGVRARIKEVTTREYIDPEAGTVDYVLVFIPNEQVYGFIHEHDPTLLDDALRQKVVLCSPLTLYAMLAVIRQTAEHFRLEQTSRQILALLSAFEKEWRKYSEQMDKMGKALEQALGQYEALVTTRTRKLERQLDKIEDLRTREEVALPSPTEPEAPARD